jgi:hypothetical protein
MPNHCAMAHFKVAAALAVLAVALLGPAATPARAVGPTIQPGVEIDASGTGCTLAWLFQRADETPAGDVEMTVFAATAAHCVHVVREPVTLDDGTGIRIGEVAFVGERNSVDGRDYAFIKIDRERHAQLDPAMAGHPQIPTGLSTSPAKGDVMQFSGWGAGFELRPETRERRQGVLNYLSEVEHRITGVVGPGDSGGPVADVTDGNTAFGIVNTVGAGASPDALHVVIVGEGGANLDYALADAAKLGFTPGELCVAGQPCGEGVS